MQYQQTYIKRMIDDWSRRNVVDVYANINMDNSIFRQKFLENYNGLETDRQKQLPSLYDTNNNSSPLIQSCFIGDAGMVQWCLQQCTSNIDHCRNKDGASALIVAFQNGHTEIVNILIIIRQI